LTQSSSRRPVDLQLPRSTRLQRPGPALHRPVAPAPKPKHNKEEAMRFLLVHRLDETKPDAFAPKPEVFAAMGMLIEDMTKAGVLLAADGVLPSSKGALVAFAGGKRTVVDGPFTEAKEVIGGYAIVQVRSIDEAIEWASRFAEVIGDVGVEVRQIAGS